MTRAALQVTPPVTSVTTGGDGASLPEGLAERGLAGLV